MAELHFHHLIVGSDHPHSVAFSALQGNAAFPSDPVAAGIEGIIAVRGDVPVARVSLHLAHDLVGAPGMSGLLGHYEAMDEAAGVQIIGAGARVLRERGAARILGPMNGNTWSRYRLAVRSDDEDCAAGAGEWFAGEPRNPPSYPAHWKAANASVVSLYESRIETLGAVDESAARTDVHVRPVDVARFSDELDALHRVSLDAFDANYLYSPVSFEAFSQMYAPFRARLDPNFVLLAEDKGGSVIGYIFSYADPLSMEDGRPTRLIIKTLAVAKAGRGQRVSSLLLDHVRRRASERGFADVISALMRTDNITRGMAARRSSRLFRRYALFGITW